MARIKIRRLPTITIQKWRGRLEFWVGDRFIFECQTHNNWQAYGDDAVYDDKGESKYLDAAKAIYGATVLYRQLNMTVKMTRYFAETLAGQYIVKVE